MDLQENHFALFGLEQRFDLHREALDRAYRDVQTQAHPDRFAGSGAAEQRVALQWATRANEAYRVLRDPLQRAIYLCTLRGRDPAAATESGMSQTFLKQQLEWREGLDAAREGADPTAIEALRVELVAAKATREDAFRRALAEAKLDTAVEQVRQWMFVERLLEDVLAAEDCASAPSR